MGWLADLLEERGSVSIQEGLGKPLASAMGPQRTPDKRLKKELAGRQHAKQDRHCQEEPSQNTKAERCGNAFNHKP